MFNESDYSSSSNSFNESGYKHVLNRIECLLHDSLPNKKYLSKNLPNYVTKICKNGNIVEILSIRWKLKDRKIRKVFRDSIGIVLLNKLSYVRGSYSKYCKWYNIDKKYAQILIASSLKSCGKVDCRLFRERFDVRKNSSRKFRNL